ncbi:MAG: glutathionylspermidine synthase family protein [Helicobacter sp.]|nr:glutathionylspermidine synthase family protein [Helicobacter sp.]
MKVSPIKPIDTKTLENMNFYWHSDFDNNDYVASDLIDVSQDEAERLADAANQLYDMFVNAGEYVIENDLFFELDIPNALIPMIKQSFEEDIHLHVYGRFDFAGGLDGRDIKLLEFNADTPTLLYESAVIQWALLKHNVMDEDAQFNNIFEALSDNFKRVITLDDPSKFDDLYEGWGMLFSSIAGNSEEEIHTRFLQDVAKSAGFNTAYAPFHEIEFNATEGVSHNGSKFEFLFKLIPWENIAIDEPELALLMQQMMANKNTIFLNPPYTLLFQSKRILKILWDLYPNHPLLLETSYSPLGKKQVKKPAFGREGANVMILDANEKPLVSKDGIYGNHKSIYQEFYALNEHEGYFYQPNVFYAYKACALGFRRSGYKDTKTKIKTKDVILDNFSQFVAHRLV